MKNKLVNWFIFTPETGSAQNPADPKQYRIFEECKIFTSNVERGEIYAIKSPVKAGFPLITHELLLEMSIAVRQKKDTENVLLRR